MLDFMDSKLWYQRSKCICAEAELEWLFTASLNHHSSHKEIWTCNDFWKIILQFWSAQTIENGKKK